MNNDLISRGALIADIEESVVFTVKGDSSSAEMRGANKIIDRIKAAPAVDAVEVVRCSSCKYHNKAPCPMRLSLNWTEDNDFCSYGERREDGTKWRKAG